MLPCISYVLRKHDGRGTREIGGKCNPYISISPSLSHEATRTVSEYGKLLCSLDFFQMLLQSEQAQKLMKNKWARERALWVKVVAVGASLTT